MKTEILKPPLVRVDALRGRTVAVLGYGSQGHAHALNLRDSGCNVIVAQRPSGPRHAAARQAGFEPCDVPSAIRAADLIIFALPDEAAPQVYREQIAPFLRPARSSQPMSPRESDPSVPASLLPSVPVPRAQTLGFIHGFNIHYRLIEPPPHVDVILVAPKAQGHGVRSEFLAGRGAFTLIAVAQDASGQARQTALAWAAGIGAGRAGVIETTFAVETETDLFGEQAVLCGGLTALIKAGFDTLVQAGYPPEAAYFECCHELKLIVDLIHAGGLTYMRERISSTARYGDLTRGPRIIDEATRARMRAILSEIQSGQFAREFLAEREAGFETFDKLTDADRRHAIEAVGSGLRAAMSPDGTGR